MYYDLFYSFSKMRLLIFLFDIYNIYINRGEYRYIRINQQIDRWFCNHRFWFFYIISILWRFESHQVILWVHFFLSSWSYNLINLVFIDRFLFIDRFNQFSWKSRYFRNSRIKLFSNRERFVKSYSTYSINNVLTLIFFLMNYVLIISNLRWLNELFIRMRLEL
jgi:hypothetical protein